MKENYSYPLLEDWSTEEIVVVMELWQSLEMAYEKGIDTNTFLICYKKFKTVVKSIGEEKKLGNEFEKLSGYSLYRTVQAAKKEKKKILKMR